MTSDHLQAETTNSILISYSRTDRIAVKKLYARLESLGFTLWRDLHDIEGGEPFWEEIKKGIDGCETVVLCMSKESLNSKFVQMEWHYARQVGKRVVPVIVGEVDFEKVPRWMGRIDWKDLRDDAEERDVVWASFIRTLNTPYDGRKVPFMADKLPDYFVNRPEEFEKIVASLVDQNGAVAITAAVKGAGGFGKTTLALALCHDNRIRGAFDDGVLWVTLGEKPTQADLMRYALDLCELITGERPTVETREAVKTELTKAIGDRYMLLVIDDLWRKNDADMFLTDSPNSAVMITTRFDHTLPDETRFTQDVDAMKTSEAVQLLSYGIDGIDDSHSDALNALTDRLGEWAVIIRLANATLRKRIGRGDSIEKAIDYANKALTRKGLQAFNRGDEGERADSVKATIEVSLELLDEEQQVQFAQLAIFPEDVDIPFTTLEKLWDLDNFDIEEVAEGLHDASLIQVYDPIGNTIQLHPIIRQYLIDEHYDTIQSWQMQFVESIEDLTSLADEYLWRNIAYHLYEADKKNILRDILFDLNYLQSKLSATDSNALIADCDYLPEERSVQLVKSALSMSAHVLKHSPEQLPAQLYARLISYADKYSLLSILLETCRTQPELNLFPIGQTLQPAGGALIRILDGHTNGVQSVAMSGEYAVSASSDQTLRVWNWRTGEALRILEGHTSGVQGVALSGEYAISASSDQTLRVWNWWTGEALRTLMGHTSYVMSVALSGEYAVSTSYDRTLCVWNWRTGEALRTLIGHSDAVESVTLFGKYAVSASSDKTLKVWNWVTGELERTLDGHTGSVLSVALLDDYAVSASSDKTLKVWNWVTGELERTLDGHTGSVWSIGLSEDYAISSSSDLSIKIWNWNTGELIRTLIGHSDWVRQVKLSQDQNLVFSASLDKTIRVWDWNLSDVNSQRIVNNTNTTILRAYENSIFSVTTDHVITIWDSQTGNKLRVLIGHRDTIYDFIVSGDYLISASADATMRVWNWQSGETIHILDQHSDEIRSIIKMTNLVISASLDGTIRLWNWITGECIYTYFTDYPQYTVCLSNDGTTIISGGITGTLHFLLPNIVLSNIVPPSNLIVNLKIHSPIESFNSYRFLENVAKVTDTSIDSLNIKRLVNGSVIISIEMPEVAAQRLLSLITNDPMLFSSFGYIEILNDDVPKEDISLPKATNELSEHHIFFSYSSKDKIFVNDLAEKLKKWGNQIWIDNASPDYGGIQAGQLWKQSLSNAINASRCLVFVLSPDSLDSPWVRAELRYAGQLRKKVIPVLIRPIEKLTHKIAIEEILIGDISLAELQHLDFYTHGTESLFPRLMSAIQQ